MSDCNLVIVLDWYTKKIVGYNISLRSRRQEWEAALDRALLLHDLLGELGNLRVLLVQLLLELLQLVELAFDLAKGGHLLLLVDQLVDRRATTTTGAARATGQRDLAAGRRAVADGGADGAVADGLAVADDHYGT